MIYRPRYFDLQELVCPEVYNVRGDRSWELLDTYALVTLDQLREAFGSLKINDWHWDGPFKYSGLRPQVAPRSGTKWNWWSQHCWGRGFDCKPKSVTPQEMHAEILKRPDKFPYLRVLENISATPSWVHWDTRNHTRASIWVVNP